VARERPTFSGANRTGELQLDFLERIVSRDLTVVRVEEVTPRYQRVVLTGDALLADGFPFTHFSPLDHVRVFFPNAGTGELVAYRLDEDDEWFLEGGSGDPINRDYTVRGWDPDARELSLDFVLHDHGVAGKWARTARPGDRLVANGPNAHFLLPENYPHYLAAGDDTALPAIARIIEEAPAGSHVTAVVEVTDAQDEQTFRSAATFEVQWVHRATAPVGPGHLSPLETALRARGLPADPESVFVVIAGETNSLKPIRRYYRQELGMRREQLVVDGYWKRGVISFDHHDVDFDEEG
jgi:NADPH-dependent ferric siderophore reductase